MQPNEFQLVEKLVLDLQSDNIKLRDPAENQISSYFKEKTSDITNALVEMAVKSTNKDVRTMSAVLLRRYLMIDENEPYKKLDHNTKCKLKEFSLKSLQNETETSVRRIVMSVINDIADIDIKQNQWPDLLPSLEVFSNSNNPTLRGDALVLFGNIAGSNDLSISEKTNIKTIFVTRLNDSDLDVRLKCFEAVVAFCEAFTENEDNIQLLNSVINLLKNEIMSGDEKRLVTFFENLIDFATICPKAMRTHFNEFVELASGLAMSRKFASDARVLALEFLVILAEEDNGLFRRSARFVQSCFMSALALMLELHDDPDWASNFESDNEEEDMYTEGEFAMDRLSQSFGSERTITVAMPLVLNLLKSPEWKNRLVGLMSISQMAESVDKSHIAEFVQIVTNYFGDENLRVKFSAIHCLGQMCDDFSPEIQKNFHGLILPALVNILKNSTVVKIQAHAGAALVNFTENVDSKIMQHYLSELFEILFTLLQSSARVVREQIVTVIASVSSATPENFHEHLEKFVPILLDHHSKCLAKEDIIFKSKCLEALTFIGVELKSRFIPVANEIMQITLREVEEFRRKSDEYFDFVLQSWIRLAKVLREKFTPYLPQVMPLLFEVAEEEERSTNNLANVTDTASDDDSEDEDYNPNTSDLNELESALCALSTLPAYVGIGFFPYLEHSAEVVNENLGHWIEDNVRTYAASSYPGLFSVVVLAVEKNQISPSDAVNCLEEFIKILVEAFVNDTEYAVKKTILVSMASLLETNEKISLAYLSRNRNDSKILKALFNLIEISQIKMNKINQKLKNVDNDEEEIKRYEMVKEFETILLFKISDIFGLIMKIKGEQVMADNSDFLEKVMLLLSNKDTDLFAKKVALLITDEIITFIPNTLQKYADFLLHLFINLLEVDDLDIKQAAIHGLGLIAKNYTPVFATKSEEVMKICLKLWELLKESKEEHQVRLRDNAVSTYGRVIFALEHQIDLKKSFPLWVEILPLTIDLDEIEHSNRLLFRVLDMGDKRCLGEDLNYLPKILNIIAANNEKVEMDNSQKQSLQNFVSKMKTLPNESQNNFAAGMSDDAKQMIMNFKAR